MAKPRRTGERVLGAVTHFLEDETIGAVILLAATAAALVWANSPLSGSYEALWHTKLEVAFGGSTVVSLDLRHWVNDALMALFFFVVGLEIKREMVEGELSSRDKAVLPAAAALGGMIVPAAIYLAFNAGGEGARGWGIPMATDIAFAVGVLSLFSRRVPRGLIVFLLALAIADDIGAILVIAVFYTSELGVVALAVASAALAGVVVLWRIERHWTDPPLVLLMFVVWAATLASGVHATIAGVALGLLAPVDPGEKEMGVAERLGQTFHPWTSRIVIPVFALANAGVAIDLAQLGDAITGAVGAGVAVGLVVGKPVGILAASFLAVRAGLARLPDGIRWPQLAGAAALAGIGFTVSLFIAQLGLDEDLLAEAKVGIFAGSLVAAVAGSALLLRVGGARR